MVKKEIKEIIPNLEQCKEDKPEPCLKEKDKHPEIKKTPEEHKAKASIPKPEIKPQVIKSELKQLPSKPILVKPVVNEPVIVKHITAKPIVAEPIVGKPVIGKSIATPVIKPVQNVPKAKPKVKVISEAVFKPKVLASQPFAKKEKKLGRKVLIITSKRKTAIAKAYVKPGKGRIVVNNKPYQLMENKFMLDIFREPLVLIEEYNKELLPKLDIEIFVHGGGTQGQLVAARNCVTKAFVQYFKDPVLEKKIVSYNRGLLVDDIRRVESKKPLGKKARAKKQHSKR